MVVHQTYEHADGTAGRLQPFYTVATLAYRWAVSERTVRTFLRRGELAYYRVGAQVRIDPEDVARYERERKGR